MEGWWLSVIDYHTQDPGPDPAWSDVSGLGSPHFLLLHSFYSMRDSITVPVCQPTPGSPPPYLQIFNLPPPLQSGLWALHAPDPPDNQNIKLPTKDR